MQLSQCTTSGSWVQMDLHSPHHCPSHRVGLAAGHCTEKYHYQCVTYQHIRMTVWVTREINCISVLATNILSGCLSDYRIQIHCKLTSTLSFIRNAIICNQHLTNTEMNDISDEVWPGGVEEVFTESCVTSNAYSSLTVELIITQLTSLQRNRMGVVNVLHTL